MHGHSLSGSRKLNRHWQSGRRIKGTGLEENLVLFEREIVEEKWPVGEAAYWYYDSEQTHKPIISHGLYSKKNPIRSKSGFKDLVILNPGDYKVHWKLETHNIQEYSNNGEWWNKIVEGGKDNRFGMFGVNMYGMGQSLSIVTQKPEYIVNISDNEKYYVGHGENYIAYGPSSPLLSSSWYTNNDIVKKVRPSRSSTYSSFLGVPTSGAPTFNMTSGQENPEIILHIGSSAPFPQYRYSVNYTRKEAWFDKYRDAFSPAIWFLFTENAVSLGVDSWIITGKIWLERIGDYTPGERGWKAEILDVPDGWTILGDKGIIS